MRLKCILLSILLGIMSVISSCDKFDCNDGLDGQWQMYEWQSSDGKHIGGKELKIYYSFQLQMMMFQKSSFWRISSSQERVLILKSMVREALE